MNITKKYIALDLEMNQPSTNIIQVGICIGAFEQPEEHWIKQVWYVDPKELITPFIVELTGITNEDIEKYAQPIEVIAKELSELIILHDVFVNPVTWGGGDSIELLELFKKENVDFPHFGRRWIDVKTFHILNLLAKGKHPSGGLKSGLGAYKMHFKGDQHRADIDAFNTLRLYFKLVERQSKIEKLLKDSKEIV